jgi:hypothetical protein
MPDFVESVANQQMPPPYHFPEVRAHAFMFEVPMSAVQRYCDTHLNLGSDRDRGFRYVPVPFFPYAALMVVQYPVMMSTCTDRLGYNETPFAQRGYVEQNEIFVAIPTLRRGLGPVRAVFDTAIDWALPFVAVDNSTSAFSGREMLGLPKLKGELDIEAGSFPDSFVARARLPGWASEAAVQELLPFLEITTGPPIGSGPGSVPNRSFWRLLSGHSLRRGLETVSAVASSLDTLSLGLVPDPMHVVALKQFRDAARPDVPVYQALVSARTRYTDLANLAFYNEDDAAITFHGYPSFLGVLRMFMEFDTPEGELSEGPPIRLKPSAVYSFTADIDFDRVRTLHTFVSAGEEVRPNQQPRVDTPAASWFLPILGFFGPPRGTWRDER